MCTDFPADVIWINTMCAVSLANHLITVLKGRNAFATTLRWFASDTAHTLCLMFKAQSII